MSYKTQKDKAKSSQDKYQSVLARLLREEDNKYCADCDAKGPRWASWNLGVFLCIRCAGIHRNLGVHISKVKSVNLDSWTEEQIMSVENGGNTVGRKLYEKHLPAEFRRPQSDSSSLENFIRAKYEHKKYMDKDYIRPPMKRLDYKETEAGDKKERYSARHKQTTLVALAKTRAPTSRPQPSGLQPSTAALLSSALSQSSPNLAAPQATQQPTSLPTTPVKTVSSANDLLGLCTPPANNVNDLLGLDDPAPPPSVSLASDAGNGPLANGSKVEVSLFGDEAAEGSGGTAGGKKTKDSIMALFSSSSTGQIQQPAFNVPGGMYIPSQQQQPAPQQQQHFAVNGYPANSTIAGYQVSQQQLPTTSNMMGHKAQGMMGQPQQPQQGMIGQPQGMMGQQPQGIVGQQPQGIVGQQPGMVGQPQSMMGHPQPQGMMGQQPHGMVGHLQPQGMVGHPQGIVGHPQGIVGHPQGMVGHPQPQGMVGHPQPQGMMGQQPQVIMGQQPQGMMGVPGMYGQAQVGQQAAYLQQIQQQMNTMRVGGASGGGGSSSAGGGSSGNTPPGQMQPASWPPSNAAVPQQQPVPTGVVGGAGGWGGTGSGQTLSNQLWK